MKPLAERLEERAVPEPNSGCLLWLGAVNDSGYGHMSFGAKVVGVHRLAWISAIGPIPAGAHVLHSCDQPSCLNVRHLFLGDHAANMRDMASKKRGKGGAAKRAMARCHNGHLFNEENTRVRVDRNSLMRECRTCKNTARRAALASLSPEEKSLANAKSRIYARAWRERKREGAWR